MQFTLEAQERLFSLVEQVTGTSQHGKYRQAAVLGRIERVFFKYQLQTVYDFEELLRKNSEVLTEFISAATIHTTAFFREKPHFRLLHNWAKESLSKERRIFRAWCAACSTGEEVYSVAMVLEDFRRKNPDFDYSVLGSDIDRKSTDIARNAVYSAQCLEAIPLEFKNLVSRSLGNDPQWISPVAAIRERVRFEEFHLLTSPVSKKQKSFDLIFCRNVLFYFETDHYLQIVSRLGQCVDQNGILCFAHSESLENTPAGFKSLGNAAYQKV